MLTDRDIAVLQALCRYFVLNRTQLQRLCFPGDETGRVTRRRLQYLVEGQLIHRCAAAMHPLAAGTPASVYYPARRGCEILAELTADDHFLLTPTQTPQPFQLLHWIAVSHFHLTLDVAVEAQEAVALEDFLNEWDVANKDEAAPEKRYRIYTLIQEQPRLVCAPDAAFVLAARGFKKVYYVEIDRNTSGVKRIAAQKTRGFAELAARALHRRHFPDTNIDPFGVLMIAPTPRRRDALAKAIADKPAAALWKFAAMGELTAESLLHAPVWHTCDSQVVALVRSE